MGRLAGTVLSGVLRPVSGRFIVLCGAVVRLFVGRPIVITAAFAGHSSVYHFQLRIAHGAFLFFASHISSRPAVFGGVCLLNLNAIIQLNLPHFMDGPDKKVILSPGSFITHKTAQ